MNDTKAILGEAIGAVTGIAKHAAGEVVATVASIPPKGIQQIAGVAMTSQELDQKRLEEEQKRQAAIQSVQAQLSQQMEMNRQARVQVDASRKQEQHEQGANPRSVSPLGATPSADIGHKLLERKSDKRHG